MKKKMKKKKKKKTQTRAISNQNETKLLNNFYGVNTFLMTDNMMKFIGPV